MVAFMEIQVLSLKWYILMGVGLLLLVIWWKSKRSKKNRKVEIKSVSSLPILRTIIAECLLRPEQGKKNFKPSDYLMPILSGLSHLYRKEKMFRGIWAGQYYIVCYNPNISEKIFHSSVALNKDWLYKELEPWLGLGLLTSGDDRWRRRRKQLTPAFHFRILNDFLNIFNEQTKILVENLKKLEGEVIDVTSVVPLCTLDIIGETAMGVRLNAQTGDCAEYVEAVKHLTSAAVKPFTTPWYWIKPIYHLSPLAKKTRKSTEFVHNFARNVIRKRKEEFLENEKIKEVFDDFQDSDDVGIKNRRAFLDLMLYHHLTDNSLSEEDIREEVDTFTFEGHDTTSMAISWTLYLLGWHKDIQEKAYQELQEIYGDDKERKVTADELKQMKYLECVIKETLRLYPSVPLIIRRTSRDIEADEYVIPANSSVVLFIYGIHYDPSTYPNPEVFDPTRFLPQNCLGRHPFSYIPFSAGSRNCIGQRFATMEVKSILAHIIRNFTVTSVDHRDKLSFVGDIILRPKEPIRLIFHQR